MKLSIIIPTKDRSHLLLETIETIAPQLGEGVELVIVDASANFPDPKVTARLTPHIRHERGKAPSFDEAYEEAVAAARGEWVWLFSDDDWFKPGAVELVLSRLAGPQDLVIVNAEVRERTMQRVLKARWVALPAREYTTGEYDRMFAELGDLGSFVGSLIIRRSVWMDRMQESRKYFGTRFLTFVVPFLRPTATKFVDEILVTVRFGHQSWVSGAAQLIGHTMAEVVWSFPLAPWSKTAVRPRQPSFSELLLWRASGSDVSKYSRMLAGTPRWAARFVVKLGLKMTGRSGGISDYILSQT